jgi:hypothetical protein
MITPRPCLEHGQDGAGAAHGAEQVDLDDSLLYVERRVADRAVGHDGSVVHPHVDAAELRQSPVLERLHGGGIGDVGRDGHAAKATRCGPASGACSAAALGGVS